MTRPLTSKNIVLYADDDPDDLDLVKEAFAQYSNNVEVVTVTEGNKALAYLKSLGKDDPSPCLIILDINMPVLDGKELLKKIRTNSRFDAVPVVLFTTSSLPFDQEFAKKYNAGFITKPLEVSQMQEIIELFINHCTDEIKRNIRRSLP